ncbi:tRNA (5-methylaminomethyl-2-thiouridine)(34)-methyltransferase MnmD [Flavobacteriaceae bacterium LMO-SS05]
MKRHIIITADGSKTIQIEDWNEQYHSVHGAIQEANHVFIKHGLQYYLERGSLESTDSVQEKRGEEDHSKSSNLSILEIGFGTGLNAFMTFLKAEALKQQIHYTGVEAYPILPEELLQLNYVEQLNAETWRKTFESFHHCPWEEVNTMTPYFKLTKQQKDFRDIDDQAKFDLIYFDAFGARVQPELWDEVIFKIMYRALRPNGVLVTYSAKGSVRRAMQAVGFLVEKLPGPPGKREMLRARKGS